MGFIRVAAQIRQGILGLCQYLIIYHMSEILSSVVSVGQCSHTLKWNAGERKQTGRQTDVIKRIISLLHG